MSSRKALSKEESLETGAEQAVLGVVAGCFAGWAARAVGGLTLTALTIAMLGVKSAEEHGYVTVHWSKLSADVSARLRPFYQEFRQAASQSPRELQTRLDEVLSLNTPGAAGFAEGLLFSCGGRKAKLAAVGSSLVLALGCSDDRARAFVESILSDASAALEQNRKSR